MAETATRLPIKSETKTPTRPLTSWNPFDSLRREVDRLFEDFDWRTPYRHSLFDYPPFGRNGLEATIPAVDVAEKDNAYEISAELPGMEDKDIEVKVADGGLVIKGEKKEAKEEKKKDYFMSERRYGSFERYFTIPEGVDADKISAQFQKGVLTVTLPKSPEAKKQEKKIVIKAA